MNHRAAPPDHAEREKALDIGHSALVIAPAGSGKTTLLVARMLKCLAVSNEPEEVVAITFTRMAAAEIRARLVRALQAARGEATEDSDRRLHVLAQSVLARDAARGWQLLENPNRLRALTIDALNLELAAGLPLLSGLGGPISIAEDATELFEEAVKRLFEDVEDPGLAAEDREAIERVLRWGDNRIDALLEPLREMLEKREQWLEHVLDQLAGAPPPESSILEDIARAQITRLSGLLGAAEIRELAAILREGSAQADSLAWAAVLPDCPEPDPAALDAWRRMACCLLTGNALRASVDVRHGFVKKSAYKERMLELLQRLRSHARAADIADASCALRDCPDTTYPQELAQHRAALLRVLRRLCAHLRIVFAGRSEADFTEVGFAALNALAAEDGYSETLDRADARIRHLLVDEMQDTSESQLRLLRQLTSGWVPGDGHSLFMVGDPQQSIYAFRKAEVRLFQRLWHEARLDDVPLRQVRLSTNFRSTAPLIRWFNDSFNAIFPEAGEPDGDRVEFSPATVPAEAAQAPEPGVRIVPLDANPAAEAEAVALRVQELEADGASVAIIARARSHLRAVLAALRRHAIAYACQDIDPLHDIPGVREFVHLARALWHPEDRLAWAVLLRSPMVGLGYADLVALSRNRTRESWPLRLRHAQDAGVSPEGQLRLAHLAGVLAQVEDDPILRADLAARAEAVWHALGGPATVSADELRDVRAAMQQLRTAARDGEIGSLAGLRRALEKAFAAPAAGRVQVLTAHKAKGLEFDHVLLVGCGRATRREEQPLLHFRRMPQGPLLVPKPDRRLPEQDPARRLYRYAQRLQDEALRNERLRVLYVCCTRARRSLTLFVSAESGADGAPRFAAESFARLMQPLLPAQLWNGLTAVAPDPAPAVFAAPLMPRLPLDYRFAPDDAAWRPRERRTLRPSEAVLDAQTQKAREGELRARLIGVMFHEAMRRIATEGLGRWQDGGVVHRDAMGAGFRRLGLAEPEVSGAVDQVLQLLARSLASPRGQWLVQPRTWAQSEYAIAGYRGGEWVSAIVDRCFEEDGLTWVVDYKTGSEPPAQAAALYGPQVSAYAALVAALRGKPARGALFLAATAEWIEVAAPATEPA